jgi:short-subunit dehydrogenase
MKDPKTILITGASSGIGAALAVRYAAPGMTLFLSGRDIERLGVTAAACRARGTRVETRIVDVTDRDAVLRWAAESDDDTPVDLAIANAGISGGTGGVVNGEPAAQARRIFDVNVTGVLNTVEGVQGRMVARGRGQIAVISSLAGFAAWPGAPAYSASKAAVRVYAEALHGSLAHTGVVVTAVCPGFIATPMTAVNGYKMPFMMDAERAADIMVRGLRRGGPRLCFPVRTYVFAAIPGLLPAFLSLWLLRRLPAKPSQSN